MLGDGSVGEAPEDLHHHVQVPELLKGVGQSTSPDGLTSCWLVWPEG